MIIYINIYIYIMGYQPQGGFYMAIFSLGWVGVNATTTFFFLPRRVGIACAEFTGTAALPSIGFLPAGSKKSMGDLQDPIDWR